MQLLRRPHWAHGLLRHAQCAVAALAASALAAGWAGGSHADDAKGMIAAANPLAAQAGADMLRAGGSAIDAAIAAQLVLGLVEPQSSGIGGGGFLLYYDAEHSVIESYDGRETAPAAASDAYFTAPDGTPLGWLDAAKGGLPVGVPGVMRMLERAHRAHGSTPWAALFEPAIKLAEEGFTVSPRLAALIAANADLADFEGAREYFFDDQGAPLQAGRILTNPEYAETLRAIAREGADALHRGAIAAEIVSTVRASAINPGKLSLTDLANYQAKQRPAVCAHYRIYLVCGAGPPSSGGLTTLQFLGILEQFDVAALAPGGVEAVHLISEASRLAFADRNRFMADSDFVAVPEDGLLDRQYLKDRAALISMERSMGEAEPGAPPGSDARAFAAGFTPELPSTSHLAVVDREGNAVSFTTSVERAFGSRLMVRGFMLNNQLTDFSFVGESNGIPVANRVEPGKRPRSSMSPTLIFDQNGELLAAIGSPGGARIIGFVTQSVVALLDWGLDVQSAIDLARHVNRNGPTELEAGTPLEALAPALEALGHEIVIKPMVSGLHAVHVRRHGLEGGADPRREGVVLGE